MNDLRTRLALLGPGLLWAGTAIGVSHLVQSTRAGAGFGMGLLWLVLAANFFKYPAFEAGPRYTAATGLSLLEGYRRRGIGVLFVFIGLSFSTMFTVVAAVTIVTAGMASALVTDAVPAWGWAGILLLSATGLLAVGQYKALETFMKAMMLLLTVSTVMCALLLIPQADWGAMSWTPTSPPLTASNMVLLAALAGWMPSAIDTSVWSSLWSLEKAHAEGRPVDPAETAFDFNVGYMGTTVLATLFVFMGAVVLFGSGTEIPNSGGAFATMLVNVYTDALGSWVRPIILVAAFSTMLSTTIACADGFPRAVEGAMQRIGAAEQPGTPPQQQGRIYWALLLVEIAVAWVIIYSFTGQLKSLVDLATGLTGVTGFAFAVLNYVVVSAPEVPAAHRPSRAYRAWHLSGMVFLFIMAGMYVIGRFELVP